MTELPFTLTNRQVRDLAWACFSPPLLHTEQLADDHRSGRIGGFAHRHDRRDDVEVVNRRRWDQS